MSKLQNSSITEHILNNVIIQLSIQRLIKLYQVSVAKLINYETNSISAVKQLYRSQ